MKTQTIHKGFHSPLQLIPACFGFFSLSRRFCIKKKVKFTDSCRYNLGNGDQADWNKLFGFCFGIFGIHQNSARFVWRYSPELDRIELAAYYYCNGQRISTTIGNVEIGKAVYLTIIRDQDIIEFYRDMSVEDSIKIHSNKPVFGCGLYFGGNRRAPQNITIKMCDYD